MVDRAVQSIEYDVSVETRTKLAGLHPPSHDRTGDLSTRLHPAFANSVE